MYHLQLGFHTTFAFKKNDVATILKAASEEKGLNDTQENLQKRTGFGNKKVSPMKTWAIRSGLVKDNLLSEAGKRVWECDPDLESPVTDWLMHFYLCFGGYGTAAPPEEPAEWGGWPYFIFSFLPQHRQFTAAELHAYAGTIFDTESAKSISKNFKYVLRAYTEPAALAACQFLTQTGDTYQAGNPELPNPYAIGYFLAELWNRDYPSETSILTKTLLNQPMGLAPILGLTPEDLEQELDRLETCGIIEQRRAVPPFQIIPRWDNPLDLLEKAYVN